MRSFRTEIEDPVVEQDIIELERKIRLFKEDKIDEEKFRSLRLARGVYGQRQPGVQMVRIKIPYGRLTGDQLLRIADVSDEYSTGRLHITTRQDIQIHHVSLDRTPELWAQLERDDVTLREACGNTVRNITASPMAGADPDEPFDVSPYADAVFKYFLRNPVNQEMGRKFKIAFSSSHKDTALTYIHDLGFIPKVREGHRGFKVMLGGGLGSQPRHADLLYEFLPEEELIPLVESVLRIFDRHGERERRHKARLKFLIRDLGLERFVQLVKEEQQALPHKRFLIDRHGFASVSPPSPETSVTLEEAEQTSYHAWRKNNVLPQKQEGYFAVGIKVHLGDFYTDQARALALLVKEYASNELRFTLRQDIIIRNVAKGSLPFFYKRLKAIGLAEIGFQSTVDITACPGTDTCNLGITSSTGISKELEKVIQTEYPHYIDNKEVVIKISGCMNACGQHNMAHIGFQGMSINHGKLVAPALQVLLGGGVQGDGQGPKALRTILNDHESHSKEEESFLDYYDRQGEQYFYQLLKPLADTTSLSEDDFIDWGHNKPYIKAVGMGECAGVVIDLIATLLFESEEKLQHAEEALSEGKWADSIYHSYAAMVNTAKALLLSEDKRTNSHASIIKNFEGTYGGSTQLDLGSSFSEVVYQINKNDPTETFAIQYLSTAKEFYQKADAFRKEEVSYADK